MTPLLRLLAQGCVLAHGAQADFSAAHRHCPSKAQTTHLCDSLAYGEQLSISFKHTEEMIMWLTL